MVGYDHPYPPVRGMATTPGYLRSSRGTQQKWISRGYSENKKGPRTVIFMYSATSSLYLSPHKVNYRVFELSSDPTKEVKLLVPEHDVPRTGTDEITHPLSRLFSTVYKNTSCVVC